MTPTLTPQERSQTLKVIDRLESEADDLREPIRKAGLKIADIHEQISELNRQLEAARDEYDALDMTRDNMLDAAEMLEADLEGEVYPDWRKRHPNAAKAEEHARAAIEKEEAPALRQALGPRDEGVKA